MTHTDTGRNSTLINEAPNAALLLGDSVETRELREVIARVARTAVNVLITGETGTGKERVARLLHRSSPYRDGPFVAINCAAIPAALLESEVFGCEKGAFTGATGSREGRLELARGGTLFLDEIGDMPLELQAKLLRVVQERAFERLGSTRTRPVECRIVAATHSDLGVAIAQGRFREDLYYRLNVFPLHVAPLRERREDIAPILAHARREAQALHGTVCDLDATALRALEQHDWPGNVRELVNLVERLAILFAGRTVCAYDLVPHLSRNARVSAARDDGSAEGVMEKSMDLRAALAALEAHLIEQALAASGGVIARAAALLNIPRTTLNEKLQKLREAPIGDEKSAEASFHGAGGRPLAGLASDRSTVGSERTSGFRLHRWRSPAFSHG